MVIVSDASIPRNSTFQVTIATLVYSGGSEVCQITSAAGKRTSPEAEHFSLQVGLLAALHAGAQSIVIFSDSLPAIESLLDCSICSGQVFSLDACKSVRPWFAEDLSHTITAWYVPSRLEWKVQRAAHDIVKSLRVAAGARPRCSLDFLKAASDESALKDWHGLFVNPRYKGAVFPDFMGPREKLILPTTAKGGQWLPDVGESISLTARFCRGATGHAPIGEFRSQFKLPGTTHCQCMFHPTGIRELQTRDHLLCVCLLVD
jgi:hypothetical protein